MGAILAPTDPVLASDVQVEHPFDQNRLRFALTGEASLNDGTAFPFLMLGLGLLGLHDLGSGLWRWVAVGALGHNGRSRGGRSARDGRGQALLYMRRTHREAVGLDDFLALGLIALTVRNRGRLSRVWISRSVCGWFGTSPSRAHGVCAYSTITGRTEDDRRLVRGGSGHPDKAPAYMAQAVLAFNEQLERIGGNCHRGRRWCAAVADLLTWRVLWLTHSCSSSSGRCQSSSVLPGRV